MEFVTTLLCCCFLFACGVASTTYDEASGVEYLKKINADIQVKTTESVLASWAYESNITDENLKHQLDVSAKLANFTKKIWTETIKYPWQTFRDPDVRRQFQKFSVLGTAILSPEKYKRYNKIISDMQSIYGKARICNYHNRSNCRMQLEPELTEIFTKSRDPDELSYYWTEWRNAAGKPVREMFKEYVDLSNEAAALNNFTNSAEFWLKDYEAKDFKEQVESLWQQLRPLYLQLHAYVRRRLREQYGESHVPKKGCIPAHLLGNMWAQSWGNIFELTAPYPGKASMDVTECMVEQGYTPLRMFKLAEEFFTSLNLSPMPDTFWKNSILEKPKDGRDLICHASAWDFYDGRDFRIKQCTSVTMEDLNTVHHEMGHIQYFLQYKNQPLVYKEGSNPGFHEAVGDVMALSVSTPKHLRKIGLLNETEDDSMTEINQLFSMALDKVAFLPFGYLMDQWRWSVFQGKTTEENYNRNWWKLREKYQGLSPSVPRSECDFDPGAKYHIVGNVPYIRYFVSFVIQFQFHRSLCIAAKEFDPHDPLSKPLHKCDIYQSKEAGELLKKMLQMGSSKPWPDAMEVLTGQRKMDASALLDYFATLQTWLKNENERTGEHIGWETSELQCQKEEDTEKLAQSSSEAGNFEDENIAYSYAEFVRQDDNSFGSSDYLEEVKPSYHPQFLSPRENEFYTNYFMPQTSGIKYFEGNEMNTLEKTLPQTDIIDISNLQRLKELLEKKPTADLELEPVGNSYEAGLDKDRPDNSDPLKEVFLVRSKGRQMEKAKILKAIFNNYNQRSPNLDSDYKPGRYKGLFKQSECKKTDANKAKSSVSGDVRKLHEKNIDGSAKKEQNLKPDKQNKFEVQDPSNFNFAQIMKQYTGTNKNYNTIGQKYYTQPYFPGNMPEDDNLHAASPSGSSKNQIGTGEPEKKYYLQKLPFLSPYSYFPLKTSTGQLPLSGQNPDLNKKKIQILQNNKGRSNLNKVVYIMLPERLRQKREQHINNEKKYVKKDYKEYHFPTCTPVVYNAVVINTGSKSEDISDEGKNWSKFEDAAADNQYKESSSNEDNQIKQNSRVD